VVALNPRFMGLMVAVIVLIALSVLVAVSAQSAPTLQRAATIPSALPLTRQTNVWYEEASSKRAAEALLETWRTNPKNASYGIVSMTISVGYRNVLNAVGGAEARYAINITYVTP
jgi:hypothetical protein